MKYVVRITIDGSESHIVEWYSAEPVDRAIVAIQVGRSFLHRSAHDLIVEVRADGEEWKRVNRWLVRPMLEAIPAP